MPVERIRVGPTAPAVADVVEYARELIAQFGWNPGSRVPEGGTEPTLTPSSEEAGFTLHDAIGEACTRLSKATRPGASGTKDWSVQTPEGELRHLRNEANALVQAELPDGMTDYKFNDKAANVDEVYAVLDGALAKAEEGA